VVGLSMNEFIAFDFEVPNINRGIISSVDLKFDKDEEIKDSICNL
jgi:hypothetical protein